MDFLTYRVEAAPAVDADVVTRELTVTVDGNPFLTFEVPGATTVFDTFDVPQGANILVGLVDIDDAGNRSEPAVSEFVAADTLPPSQPAFTINVVAEKHVDDAPPAE